MRIIAGTYRGRVIKAVPGMNTRPTLDQVKEAIFNALGQFFSEGVVLDLFAGSGNLGLEALSRGCSLAHFVDKNYQAIETIKANIATLKVEDKTFVYKTTALEALKKFSTNKISFDFVFIDPPYKDRDIDKIIQFISENNLLNHNGMIICEMDKETTLNDEFKEIERYREYLYGMTKIIIYIKEGVTSG